MKERWEMPFVDNYLHAVNALEQLHEALAFIGMGGSKEYNRLVSAVIAHGASTFRDMLRENANHE